MNGKHGDNPLSNLTIHGKHPFPLEVEKMLRRIDELGRSPTRWPLGENWPFSLREFEWAEGKHLTEAKELLGYFISMLEAGRGDEVMIDPATQKPFLSTIV